MKWTEFINDAGLAVRLKEQYDIISQHRKQVLFAEHTRPRFLYYIVSGKIKCYRIHEDGKEYITDFCHTGDFVGYTALLEDKNYDHSAFLLEDCRLLQIPREDFIQMIFTDVSVASAFVQLMIRDIQKKENRLMILAYSSLRKRIAYALIDIHEKFNDGDRSSVIEISREDIAHYTGTATESLIRTLSDFKTEKLIRIEEGKIMIPDRNKLQNLVY